VIDQTTPKGRILAAALTLAARKSWADVTLLDVAEAAGVSLVELRKEFGSKGEILAAVIRAADEEVLKRVKRSEGQAPRDILFDVIMTRFEVLGPYKSALKSIYTSGPADPMLIGPYLASQHWMLEAAGIGTDGLGGSARVLGLASTYASVFRTWLHDDDPGLARTMAVLDRRLRRGERALRNAEDFCRGVSRLVQTVPDLVRSFFGGRRPGDSKPTSEAGSV
jgi:AcrR family transcriptional regulator